MTAPTQLQRCRRILVIAAETLDGGYGAATALRTFMRAARDYSAWHITLCVPQGRDATDPLPDSRVTIVPVRTHNTGRQTRLLDFAARCACYWRVLRDTDPDVIISWQPLPSAFIGSGLARMLRVPHIIRTCGPELARMWSPFPTTTVASKPFTRRLLRGADTVVVKSRLERELLNPTVPTSRIYHIPNAVDDRFFVTPRTSVTHETKLLSVCQLESHKHVNRLIDSVRAVNDAGAQRCTLTIVGDGSKRAAVHRAAAASNGAVRLLGRATHETLPGLYATHDAFFIGSSMEGCSNAVLESMAAQLPVVGTRMALGDLVNDEFNGILAESPYELETALRRFIKQQSCWPGMRAAAWRTAIEHTPARLVSSYSELLDGIC